MAAAGVCWGVYSLLGRQADAPLPRTFTNFALAAGAGTLVLALPLALHMTTRGVLLAAISGSVASGLGYTPCGHGPCRPCRGFVPRWCSCRCPP